MRWGTWHGRPIQAPSSLQSPLMERQLWTFSIFYIHFFLYIMDIFYDKNHHCPSQHTDTHLLLRFKSSMPNCKSLFYSGFTYFTNTDCLNKTNACLGSYLWLVHQQIQPRVYSSSSAQKKRQNIVEKSQFSWYYVNHGAKYFHC